jgi:hypothetical protein
MAAAGFIDWPFEREGFGPAPRASTLSRLFGMGNPSFNTQALAAFDTPFDAPL